MAKDIDDITKKVDHHKQKFFQDKDKVFYMSFNCVQNSSFLFSLAF